MKRKRVWRYYCDFCKKSNCSGPSISDHEAHCTMNPDRRCGMCRQNNKHALPIAILKDALLINLDALRSTCAECPACTLAAIRQSGKSPSDYDYDYTAACEQFWVDLREKWDRESDEATLQEMHGDVR